MKRRDAIKKAIVGGAAISLAPLSLAAQENKKEVSSFAPEFEGFTRRGTYNFEEREECNPCRLEIKFRGTHYAAYAEASDEILSNRKGVEMVLKRLHDAIMYEISSRGVGV